MPHMRLRQAGQAIENANLYTYLGKIDEIVGTAVESTGPACKIGDVYTINIPDGKAAVYVGVMGFWANKVLLMPYEEIEGVGYGGAVKSTGERLRIPVTNRLIGRTADAMGIPMDNKGSLGEVSYYPITGRRSNPMDRPPIDSVIQMGVKAINGLLTIGKGQGMGTFSGSGVGKSTLISMIARNAKADVNVIALVGERSREVVGFIRRDLSEEGSKRSVLVVATSNESSMKRARCTMTATAIAEYSRDQGVGVLLMMGSLTRYAMIQRETGLSIGEPPVARGYTPFIYSKLPGLLERSGNFEEGSATGIYTVLIEGDNTNKPVSDTIRGIVDGYIILSRKVTMRNRYPAIDVLASISRLMTEIAGGEHEETASKIRKLLAVYENNVGLVSIGVYERGANKGLDYALERVDKVYEFLQQRTDESFSLEQTVVGMTKLME